jgi:hypothetical protein
LSASQTHQSASARRRATALTPIARERYRIGLPRGGLWLELLNTDAAELGGSGMGNSGAVWADSPPSHGAGVLGRVDPPSSFGVLAGAGRSQSGLTAGLGTGGWGRRQAGAGGWGWLTVAAGGEN